MPNLAQLTDAYYTDPVPAELPVEQPYLGVPADPDGLRRVYINTPSREALPGEVATTGRPEPRPEPGIEENPLEVWAKKKAEGASLWDNLGMAGVEDKSGKSENKLLKKLFGLGGEERYQLWPEKVLREGLAGAGEVMDKGTNLGLRREDVTDIPPPQMPTIDSTRLGKLLGIAPVAASPQDDIIEKAQAISALAGSGGLAGTTDATLGSAPFLRPALKYKDRLYKGKEGQQHMDVIPKELYPEFEKMAMSGEDISHYNFGFVNDKGQFLTREKALEYGINTGLIDPHAGKFGALTSTLMADSSKPGTAIEAVAKSNIKNKIIAYHGTTSDFEKFKAGDIGVHFGNVKQANSRLQDISTGTRGDRIIPVEIETKNPLLMKDVSEWEFPENIINELYNHSDKFSKSELNNVLKSDDKNKALTKLIEDKGYDSIKYLNRWEGLDAPLLDADKLTDAAFKKLRPEADYSYIAFKPNTVKSKLTGATLFADSSKEGAAIQANKPTFYSAVEHNLNTIPQSKMTGDQWLGTLSNKPGVKGEELDWTGLKSFLEENKGKSVTKEQIQEHLAANKVELKEVNKGAIQDPIVRYLKDDYQTTKEIRNAEDIANAKKYNAHFKETVKGMTDEEILKAARAAENVKDLGDTKYHSYQLPGGKNYREMLLTLPPTKNILNQFKVINEHGHVESTWTDKAKADAWATKHNYTVREDNPITLNGGYRSSHWDEPNILAHVRMNDRTMPVDTYYKVEGLGKDFKTREEAYAARDEAGLAGKSKVTEHQNKKSLHLEEIQSDWHQQGRDRGYKDANTKTDLTPLMDAQDATRKALSKAIEDSWLKYSNGKAHNYREARDLLPDEAAIIKSEVEKHQLHDKEFLKIQKASEDANEAYYAADRKAALGVPDAPFKKSWHELALKRMIREAAEKGYDRLSWTPGEAQAARYDLSKSVNKLAYNPESGHLQAYNHDNRLVIDKPNVTKEQLADNIGKEAAKKILEAPNAKAKDAYAPSSEYHLLEGQDLKIGGEGMKGFYDQIIPKALEKLGKEHGVKVKTYELDSKIGKTISQMEKDPSSVKIHYIDIPQSLKDTALQKGFPLFSKGGYMLVPVQHIPDFSDDKK